MFSLTLTPTALIGLNDKLKIPKNFSVKSGAKPSLFAYPEPTQPPKKEETAKTAAAVLSTAAKAKALKEKKEKESELKKVTSSADVDMDDKASISNSMAEGMRGDTVSVAGMSMAGSVAGMSMAGMSVAATPGTTVVGSAATESVADDLGSEMMEVDDQAASSTAAASKEPTAAKAEEEKAGDEASKGSAAGKKDDKKAVEAEEKKEPEPTEEILNNPCRVLKAQMQHISFPKEIDGQAARYTPLLESRRAGFLLLRDSRPEEPEDLFLEDDKGQEDEKEPDPPEPFEWTDSA